MNNLYSSHAASLLKERIGRLSPDSRRQWGKMEPGQALAHCSRALEDALGLRRPKRMLAGRIFGRFNRILIVNEEQMPRNAPSEKSLIVRDSRDLNTERARLCELIDRFAVGGPSGCTNHPHSFWGTMTPTEWATWMYKHLDHHLRQFGA